jgi:rRNA maturation protein Nop10
VCLGVLGGDPAPAQLCALLVLECQVCGSRTERWRPSAYAEEFGALVILMGLRCVKCGGEVRPTVPRFECRVPDGPVEVLP